MVTSPADADTTDTRNLTREAAKGGGIALAGLLAGQVIALAANLVLARGLGASLFGIFVLGLSVISVSLSFSIFGVTQAVVRYGAMYSGARDGRRLKGTLVLGLAFSLAVSLLLALALFLSADLFAMGLLEKPDLAPLLRALAMAFPLYALVRVASASLRSLKRIDYDVGIQQVLQPGLNLILVSIAFLLGHRLLGAISGLLVSLVLSAVLAVWMLVRSFPGLVSDLAPTFETRSFFSYATPLFFVGLSANLLNQIDRIVLGYYLPADQVGIYSAAAMVASKASIVLTAFGLVFGPMISDLHHRSQVTLLDDLFKTVTKWTVSVTLPVCIVLALFSREVLGIFGPEFPTGHVAFVVLILGQLVNVLVGRVGSILIMTGKQKIELANGVLTLVLVILLNVVLVPRHGITGAAVATAIGISVINLGRLIEVYALLRIHPYRPAYWKPVFAGMLSIGFGLWIKTIDLPLNWLWLFQAAAIGAFFVISVILLGIDPEDQAVWFSIRSRLTQGFR